MAVEIFMISLHQSMGPGWDWTRDPWICSQSDTLLTELPDPVLSVNSRIGKLMWIVRLKIYFASNCKAATEVWVCPYFMVNTEQNISFIDVNCTVSCQIYMNITNRPALHTQSWVWLQIQGSRVPVRSWPVPFFLGDWSWNNFYGHYSRRVVVRFAQSTG